MTNIRRFLTLAVLGSAMALGSIAGSEEIQADPSSGATVAVSGEAGTEVFVLAKQEDGTYATATSAIMTDGGEAALWVPVASPDDPGLVVVAIGPDGSVVWATQDVDNWYWE